MRKQDWNLMSSSGSLQNLIRQLCHGDLWLPWLPLSEAELPHDLGGLYQIRMQGGKACIYIGETENYKRRLDHELRRSLRAKTMPRSEEHTSELQSPMYLVHLYSFPTRRSSDLLDQAVVSW